MGIVLKRYFKRTAFPHGNTLVLVTHIREFHLCRWLCRRQRELSIQVGHGNRLATDVHRDTDKRVAMTVFHRTMNRLLCHDG